MIPLHGCQLQQVRGGLHLLRSVAYSQNIGTYHVNSAMEGIAMKPPDTVFVLILMPEEV